MSCRVTADDKLILTQVPLASVIQSVDLKQLKVMASTHGIPFVSRMSSTKLLHLLADHGCADCPPMYTVLSASERTGLATRKKRSIRNSLHKEKSRKSRLDAAKLSETIKKHKARVSVSKNKPVGPDPSLASFPPTPLTESTEERIIRQTCLDITPDKFVEAGCGVCGQLALMTDLVNLSTLEDIGLNMLVADGVTRAERFNANDPVLSLPGPVLASGCDSVCKECV
ncbi:hypothetical protein C8J57DRAFT_1102954, partial [Mycena rebaudengoi]